MDQSILKEQRIQNDTLNASLEILRFQVNSPIPIRIRWWDRWILIPLWRVWQVAKGAR